MRMYLIDVRNGTHGPVDIDNRLEAYYKTIGCEYIDITMRSIGGKDYDIIIDDEGLMKSGPIVSAAATGLEPVLVGNLLVCNFKDTDDGTGEDDLTDEDVANIRAHVRMRPCSRDGEEDRMVPLLCGVEYPGEDERWAT